MKTLAIIHTTPATIASLSALVKELSGEITIRNFLDDSILPEINQAGHITPGVRVRFYHLAEIAATAKPDALLCACSSVGGLLEECRDFLPIPAYRIDEPMAELAVKDNDKIVVAATLQSTLKPTMDLITRKGQGLGKDIEITPLLIEGAGQLLAAGRMEEYEALIAGKLSEAAKGCSCIVLAQASMAGAAAKAGNLGNCAVLSSPRMGMEAALASIV